MELRNNIKTETNANQKDNIKTETNTNQKDNIKTERSIFLKNMVEQTDSKNDNKVRFL